MATNDGSGGRESKQVEAVKQTDVVPPQDTRGRLSSYIFSWIVLIGGF